MKYADRLPGTPPAPGNAYVYDDLKYVVLGQGVGLVTPAPAGFLLALTGLVFFIARLRR